MLTQPHYSKQICTPTNNLPKIDIIGVAFVVINLIRKHDF